MNATNQTPIVIPMLDPILHSESHPMCFDGSCPCREDMDNLQLLNELMQEGVLTRQEVDTIMKGDPA